MTLDEITIKLTEVAVSKGDRQLGRRIFEIETSSNIWCFDFEEWLQEKIDTTFGKGWKFLDVHPIDDKDYIMIEKIDLNKAQPPEEFSPSIKPFLITENKDHVKFASYQEKLAVRYLQEVILNYKKERGSQNAQMLEVQIFHLLAGLNAIPDSYSPDWPIDLAR